MLNHIVIKIVENMSMENRMRILKFLDDRGVKIHEGNDGTRINLSTMDKDDYDALVDYINKVDNKIDEKYTI